jgi:hypothetical protein
MLSSQAFHPTLSRSRGFFLLPMRSWADVSTVSQVLVQLIAEPFPVA